MNCKDCIYWYPIGRPKDGPMGFCYNAYSIGEDLSGDDVLTFDSKDTLLIKTGPMFGCVHFKRKPEEK